MAGYERTRKGVRNSFVAVAVQVVSLLVGFFSRKIFLDYLGTEVLGLNTTASSLLNFLNLAELGIETAISYTLYKPLYEKDETSIREIIAIQGWFYRRVALVIIAGSLLLMPFFPLIFTKMQLPMWYAYASYLVLLFSALLGYFVNYKQVILTADQQDYKFQMSFRVTMIVKVVFQMVSVKYLNHPYVWWLVWEAVFAVVAALMLNSAVYRNYPFMRKTCRTDRELIKKYPQILTKIKQVFIHRMGFFVTAQSAPILIYSFTTLSTVAVYGNYMVIVNSLNAVLVAIFSSLTASIGNMVAEGDKKLIMKVFRELFTTRFAMVAFCCFSLFFLADPFVGFWLGKEYVIGIWTLVIIIFIFFMGTMNACVEAFLNAYGMFQDTWVPVARGILYLALAIILGRVYGLNGVLVASFVEIFLVGFFWKPYFLFRWGMKAPVSEYVTLYGKLLLVFILSLSIIYPLQLYLRDNIFDIYSNLLDFVKYALIICGSFAVLFFGLLYAMEKSMRSFVDRFLKISSRKYE